MTHLKNKGIWRVCKKYKLDYKHAVIGFEYGQSNIYPIKEGIVVKSTDKDKI